MVNTKKKTRKMPGHKTAARARKAAEMKPETVRIRVSVQDGAAFEQLLNDPERQERLKRIVQESTRRIMDDKCAARFDNAANFSGIPAMPVDAAERADNAAVDALADAMKERLTQKRAAGYGGWNDPTQCDARKLADLLLNKLFGTADLPDLGNYVAFLHHFEAGGQYALRQAVATRVAKYAAERDAARKDLLGERDAANQLRAELAETRQQLSRALGYIDRVNEDEPAPTQVPDTIYTRTRGPRL